MPNAALTFRPGIDIEATPALNEGGFSACNLVRFKNGKIQKQGGWVKYYPASMGSTPRAVHAWADLSNVTHLAVGCTSSLNVITSGAIQTITPQSLTTNPAASISTVAGTSTITVNDAGVTTLTALDAVYFATPVAVGGLILSGLYAVASSAGTGVYTFNAASNATATVVNGGAVPSFTTVMGGANVVVTLAAHGLSVNNSINFAIPTVVGGVTIVNTYIVSTINSANTFTISASAPAASTATVVMNGGNAQFNYSIGLGPAAAGAGYGVGTYGTGTYGVGTTPSGQIGTPITATDYTFDNFGELLISCPENGGVYYWGPGRGQLTAIPIAAAPAFNKGLFIAMPAQILVTYGSTLAPSSSQIGTIQDPMIVQWSDQLDPTSWTPTLTNQAGNFRIPRGSTIVGAVQGPNQAYIWTDLGCWTMQYQGINNFVFGFNEIGQGCGLVGKHARCVLRGNVYFMSQNNFYGIGSGPPQVLPCTVWDVIFQDLDTANQSKCCAIPNSLFNEVKFCYPSLSGGTGECDKYVRYNVVEGVWDYGVLPRSAGVDQSVLGPPIETHPNGLVYQHEVGQDADGAPMTSFFETGLVRIANGNDMVFVDLIYPDMKWTKYNGSGSATVNYTLTGYNVPSTPNAVKGPYSTTSASVAINTRIRDAI